MSLLSNFGQSAFIKKTAPAIFNLIKQGAEETVQDVKSVVSPEKKAMTFTVGEGMTPKQKQEASVVLEKQAPTIVQSPEDAFVSTAKELTGIPAIARSGIAFAKEVRSAITGKDELPFVPQNETARKLLLPSKKSEGVKTITQQAEEARKFGEQIAPERFKKEGGLAASILGFPILASLEATPIGGGEKKGAEILGKNAQRFIRKASEKGIKFTEDAIGRLAKIEDKITSPQGVEKINRAYNILLEKYPNKVADKLKQIAEENAERFKITTRGKISNKELIEMASREDGALQELLSSPLGTVLSPEKAVRVRQDLADAVYDALQNFDEKTDLSNVLKIQERVSGITAESGRLQQSYKIVLEKQRKAVKLIEDKIKETQNPFVKKQLEQLKQGIGGKEFNPTWITKLVEFATAAKLSHLVTSLPRAIFGNAFSTALRVPEKIFSGSIDATRALIMGKPQERFVQEAVARNLGVYQSLKNAGLNAANVLRDEGAMFAQSSMQDFRATGAIPGKLGKIIRIPFRVQAAPDAFFRTLNNDIELNSLLIRDGLRRGLKGEELADFVGASMKNPPKEFVKEAERISQQTVFQDDLIGFWAEINRLRENFPASKLVVPFFKTPVNIAKQTMRRVPFMNLFVKEARENIKAGGGAMSDELGKVATGALIMSAFVMHALEGGITGDAPTTKDEKDAFFREGKLPNAVRIGNRYIQHQGLEPLSSYLKIASQIAENNEEKSDKDAMKIVLSFVSNFSNQPFLTGTRDILNAVTNPGRYGERFLSNFVVGNTIPNLSVFAKNIVDPVQREPEGIVQTAMAKLPGLSKMVPPKRNAFGEEIVREASPFSPQNYGVIKESALEKELKDLEVLVPGFDKSVTIRGAKLSQEQADKYKQAQGKVVKKVLEATVGAPSYMLLSDEKKKELLQRRINKVVDKAREEFFVDAELMRLGFDKEEVGEKQKAVFRAVAKKILSKRDYTKMEDEERKARLQNIFNKINASIPQGGTQQGTEEAQQ